MAESDRSSAVPVSALPAPYYSDELVRGSAVSDRPVDSAARTLSYECFICFKPMTTDQDLIQNPTGIVTHRVCMEDDDDAE